MKAKFLNVSTLKGCSGYLKTNTVRLVIHYCIFSNWSRGLFNIFDYFAQLPIEGGFYILNDQWRQLHKELSQKPFAEAYLCEPLSIEKYFSIVSCGF